MTGRVTNRQAILGNSGSENMRQARSLLLQAYEAAIEASDPERIISRQVRLDGHLLRVLGQTLDLNNYSNIYVVGAGKAGAAMGAAIEAILGDLITAGRINVPRPVTEKIISESAGQTGSKGFPGGWIAPENSGVCGRSAGASRIILNYAGHPVPDIAGVEGARTIIGMVQAATGKDLVICLISGGGSSLLPLPRADITLVDKQSVTGSLLACGASIGEINAVRKHISAIKGGWLAKKAWPATLVNLVLSDVIGDPLDIIASGPTVPDSTSFTDAVDVLKKYDLWSSAPLAVRQVLIKGCAGKIPENPRGGDEAFARVFNHLIGSNAIARNAMAEYFRQAGAVVEMIEQPFTGDVAEAAAVFSGRLEALSSEKNLAGPLVLVGGGETTVKVAGDGSGGRNQELALRMVEVLNGRKNVVFAALSTDGIDGPTDAAGAVADGFSFERAFAAGLDTGVFLRRNDSYGFFAGLGDLVCTGYTGTNVNDLYVVLIMP